MGTIILKIYFYKKILTTVYIEMYLNTPIIFNNFYHNIFKCECLDVSHLKYYIERQIENFYYRPVFVIR